MMKIDTTVVTDLTEDDLVELDKKTTGEEYAKGIKSWIIIKLPWWELIESTLKSNDKVDPYLHLININTSCYSDS